MELFHGAPASKKATRTRASAEIRHAAPRSPSPAGGLLDIMTQGSAKFRFIAGFAANRVNVRAIRVQTRPNRLYSARGVVRDGHFGRRPQTNADSGRRPSNADRRGPVRERQNWA